MSDLFQRWVKGDIHFELMARFGFKASQAGCHNEKYVMGFFAITCLSIFVEFDVLGVQISGVLFCHVDWEGDSQSLSGVHKFALSTGHWAYV